MNWCKLHCSILGDPKLMRASREGARQLELLPWLLAFAKLADDDGRLSVGDEPADARDIAQLIPGCRPSQIKSCCESLEMIGVLRRDQDGTLRFQRWTDYQTKPSAHPSAIRERVQKHRALRKTIAADTQPRSGNGLHVTPSNAIEEKREREEEKRSERMATADADDNNHNHVLNLSEEGGWPADFAQMYSKIGHLNPGHIGRRLAPVRQTYGAAVTREMWDAYIRARPHLHFGSFEPTHYDVRFMGPEDFVKTAHVWWERCQPIEPGGGGADATA
jgi:hypothetical protein